MAFYEQYNDTGWYLFSLGCLGAKWELAVKHHARMTGGYYILNVWTTKTIHAIWIYTKSMWKNRNEVVHGKTLAEEATCIMSTLHDKVIQHYSTYTANPLFILHRFHYLWRLQLSLTTSLFGFAL
jgi:hypothetical protein